jgi:hypothetical protein
MPKALKSSKLIIKDNNTAHRLNLIDFINLFSNIMPIAC